MRSQYRHRAGDHCGSTSLRNLADYYDWGFDEPACFGLGAGIGFSYFERGPASRMFLGRSDTLEPVFFDHLGVDVTHEDGQSRDAAWHALESRLAADPVLCFVDLYYLDYFETSTHFGPHTVVVTDVTDDTVRISDSEFADPQTVSRSAFDDAWNSMHGFGSLDRRWLAVDDPERGRSVEEATRQAIGFAASDMLHGGGIDEIRAFARDLPEWNTFEDVQWTARFAYQNIERRGTGGSAFRRLYADFLDTLGVDAGLAPTRAARLRDICSDWSTLAGLLQSVSETETADDRDPLLADASDLAATIADREEALFDDLERAL